RAKVSTVVETLDTTLDIKPLPQEEKQNISYYVKPYEPPIPFPRRLEQHAEEALVHETMESLMKIRVNSPLLKEIRQTDDYAKHIKNLVANKPKTEEDDEVRKNPRCSALLQNLLPPKEQDTRSFILLCSIRRIDKFIFPVDFVILDMVEDFRMPIILGRPLLATAHAQVDSFRKSISLKVGNEKVIFMSHPQIRSSRNSLKALNEGYSSKNYVRKFLRALHPKWRAKVTTIEESKDLTSLSLDELSREHHVHEMDPQEIFRNSQAKLKENLLL
ncbi:reverse transcriptase domain-containing protein, partial [Tanacetum coccineum]